MANDCRLGYTDSVCDFFQRRRARWRVADVASTVSSSNESATAMSFALEGVTEKSNGRRPRSATGT